MPLQKIKLRPGINRSSTNYDNEGGYFACDKIRFRAGTPEKIGGWVKYMTATVSGTCRNLFNWVTLDNTNILAIGTNTKLYIEASGGLYDITPIRSSGVINANPIASTSGSNVLVVTDTSHGAVVGDYVTLSGATAVGGWSMAELNREHQISKIVDDSKYEIVMASAATVTTTGGGASVTAAYQISSTADVSVPGKGWNVGGWGREGWNEPASAAAVIYSTLRLWSIESWGEDLVFCTRNGQIYYWDFSDGLNARASLLSAEAGASNVPLVATCMLMSTQERIMIALGTNPIGTSVQDPLLVRWCDRENLTDWLPSATNTAGDLRVSSGNYIVTAKKLKQEILIFTDASIHSMQFVGAPDIYGMQPVADNISIVSPQSVAVVNSAAFWMGNDKFYFYNGRADTLPCSIDDYIFSDINVKQADQFHCGTNERFSEIWWFYCSANSNDIDRYVIYNYDEKTWAYGTMNRTAWLDSSLKESPVAASNSTLYYHEKGVDDDRTTPINAWVESSDFNLGNGDQIMFAKRVLPDISFVGSEVDNPVVTMSLVPRNAPGAPYKSGNTGTVLRTASLPVEVFTEQLDVRLRGRQLKMRVESNQLGVHWQLGTPRIEMQPDGGK